MRPGARWPTLGVEPDELVAHLALHVPPNVDRLAHLRSLPAEDLYLAYACSEALPGAVEAFDEHYLARVPAFVAHIDRSPPFADEIRQVMRERLLVARSDGPPRIADYAGRGALMVWVRLCAVRVALNQRGRVEEARRADDATVLDDLAADSSPELKVLRTRYASVLTEALKGAVAALDAEQRIILRMYYASGQNTQRIATALRVDRSTAARRLVAARQAVFDATRRLLQEQLPVDIDEFASLARAPRQPQHQPQSAPRHALISWRASTRIFSRRTSPSSCRRKRRSACSPTSTFAPPARASSTRSRRR
jgi:RNA polymerase sigma-70 factor (ECF subfamily)